MTDTYDDTNPDEIIDATEPVEQPVDQRDDTDTSNKEAAKYRRRLRDAEAERDTLRGQVEALQRAEVERIAGRTIENPTALWAAGTELVDLLNEAGNPDPSKVKAATATAAESLGLARRRTGPVVPREGNSPDYSKTNSWADAFDLQSG